MIRPAATLAVLATALAAMPAAAQEQAELEAALAQVFADNGCAMTQGEAVDAFAAAGYDSDQTRAAGEGLADAGAFEEDDETNVLYLTYDGLCDGRPGSKKATKAQLIEALAQTFAQNGCAMTENEAERAFEAKGYSESQFDIAGEALDDEYGAFEQHRDPFALLLTYGEGCPAGKGLATVTGQPFTVEPSESGAVDRSGNPREVMERFFVGNGCVATEDELTAAFGEPSAPENEGLDRAVENMMDAEMLVPGPDGESMVFRGGDCAETAAALMDEDPAQAGAEAAEDERVRAFFVEAGCVADEAAFDATFGDEANALEASLMRLFVAGEIDQLSDGRGVMLAGECEEIGRAAQEADAQ